MHRLLIPLLLLLFWCSGPFASYATSHTEYQAQPGPWGKIRGSYIYIEAPQIMFDHIPIPSLQPRWIYPEQRLTNLPGFFRQAGLGDILIARLLDEHRLSREKKWVQLRPSLADVESLSRSSRATLYTDLAQYPPNEYQVDPLLIIDASVAEWYQSSKLRPALIAKIEQLSYPRNDILAFSDIQILLSEAQSDAETRQIFKAFTRTRSLLLRIALDNTVDVEELINYWSLGAGIRRKDIEPILLSIIESPSQPDLPLSHLLPPLARKLIFTYPQPATEAHGALPDCHWTSLNFFNYEPDPSLLDSAQATRVMLERFAPVDPPNQYGDILLFLDGAGDAFHSCVYLADNLVFTKNGRNVLSPWVIMTLEDLEKIYRIRGKTHIQIYRDKSLL